VLKVISKKEGNKVLKNASWIVACKIMQSICAFIIGALTARYLGPTNYGLISYAASIVAFFLPLMQLGFNSTLVREFISQPEKEGEVLGTSLVLNILSSIACIIGITTFSVISTPNEKETIIVCFLYSLTLLFQASEMTQYWFQAKLLSKYPSVVSLIAYVIVALYKVYILVVGKSVRWFAVTHVIEAIIIASALLIIYLKCGKQRLSFSFSLAKEMFSRSKHYISSAMMVVVFQQTDRLMLKWMLNEAETGYYSASLTCIGITGFVFAAIIDSARPSILESKKRSEQEYHDKMVMLFSIISILSIAQSVGMTIFAKLIVNIVFGKDFLSAVPILQIAVWYVMFGNYGSVRNVWILAEEKQKHLWKINLSGALINVALNSILIPILGGRGAALASLITQLFINVALTFVIKAIRPCGRYMIECFKPSSIKRVFSLGKR
jgi:O-antigen/teichoic acid export membrane protein